jgi:hypothetical protein
MGHTQEPLCIECAPGIPIDPPGPSMCVPDRTAYWTPAPEAGANRPRRSGDFWNWPRQGMSEGEYDAACRSSPGVGLCPLSAEERRPSTLAVAKLKELVESGGGSGSSLRTGGVFGSRCGGKEALRAAGQGEGGWQGDRALSDAGAVRIAEGREKRGRSSWTPQARVGHYRQGRRDAVTNSRSRRSKLAFLDGGFQAFGRTSRKSPLLRRLGGVDWGTLSSTPCRARARVVDGSPSGTSGRRARPDGTPPSRRYNVSCGPR